MAQRATSLGPKPSLFCFLFFLLFCFFWRVEGSGEVARRATSLGPKPSLFYSCFFLFLCFSLLSFLCFFLIDKKPVIPLKKGILVVHPCVFPFVSFKPFWGLLLFHFLFLGVSLVIFFRLFCFSFLYFGSCFFFLFCLFFLSSCSSVFFFFCLLSVFLNHSLRFVFALHLVFLLLFFLFVFVAFIFCYFLNFGNLSKNISEKHGNSKNSKSAEKGTF